MRLLQQYYVFIGGSCHSPHLSIPSQGNVRSVVRHDGAVVESNEYYHYGGLNMLHIKTEIVYKY